MGVLCWLGTAVNFEHPLRRCAPRPLRGAKGREVVCFVFLWVPACAGITVCWRCASPCPLLKEGVRMMGDATSIERR